VGISRASAGKIIPEVSEAIASLRQQFIFMPRNAAEMHQNFQKFFEIGSFPTVAGTIDCTHIKISGQGGTDGEIYRNRKQYYSINVQSISGADLEFLDIVVRWPGSTHDSFIFNNSRIKARFEDKEFGNAVLLGGYKLHTYLMTPFRNPTTDDEQRYNQTQIKVRNTVERKYGVWKKRFPCLVFGLRCKLETSLTVIVACAVLHNFCIKRNETMPENSSEENKVLEDAIAAADVGSSEISQSTHNLNRAAVFKRESFVRQIAQMA
jgi:nuclease HARBI1